ncbi:MAG: DUF1343 domain-containing protein [Actinomycetota bacterium]
MRVGAQVWADDGFTALDGRRVGLLTNSAARIDDDRTVLQAMAAAGIEVVTVFTPEHGFSATVAAGAAVGDGSVDGVRIISLYGADRAPSPADLAELDVLVFDLQDVGVRAYTYLATLGLALEAAAAADVPVVVLDRPNPLGDRVREGWVTVPTFTSFVSQYPVPATHGLTAGELAQALRGERWLPGVGAADLTVVPVEGWRRTDAWATTGLTWHPPSPSLPTTGSVALYPGTVLLEATTVSLGRGTDAPFTVAGAPWVDGEALAAELNGRALPGVRFEPTFFTPVASEAVPAPPFADQSVPGVRIVIVEPAAVRPVAIGVHVLDALRRQSVAGADGEIIDRPEMLDLLAGTDRLRLGLQAGTPAAELVASWEADIAGFDALRAPYLLYG